MANSRVFLVERESALAEVLGELLTAEGFDLVPCRSLVDVWANASGAPGELAIVDWRHVENLLVKQHRRHLGMLSRVVPVVLLVSEPWGERDTLEEVGVTVLLLKPFDLDRLLLTAGPWLPPAAVVARPLPRTAPESPPASAPCGRW